MIHTPIPGESGTNAYNKAARRAHEAPARRHAREVNPEAYFINENLATAKEENEMAEDGELNFGPMSTTPDASLPWDIPRIRI